MLLSFLIQIGIHKLIFKLLIELIELDRNKLLTFIDLLQKEVLKRL